MKNEVKLWVIEVVTTPSAQSQTSRDFKFQSVLDFMTPDKLWKESF